ncbi:hypothetical protein CERSUDRAFT_88396 [Gelatoporia subvermispora B]|uniref:DRBM domain-containing protein n=1 Tax=Ceriporiopsis subvermispora (strain B) TaxID=914234 RepID=M2QZU3_CERS8|nr:hypothetical protein CERSUDRAFT_88396 [Gelatoporia subvermispora B]
MSRMHWKMELNNLCQTTGARETWDLQVVGPEHQQVWYATVYINGVQCGYGTGSSKRAAQESASQQAYHTLTNARR